MRNMSLMRKSIYWKSMILVFGTVLMIGCSIFSPRPKAKRVFLIGIDGVGTDAFQFSKTPNLNALAKDGAISLMARGVMPTVSTPIWGDRKSVV